MKIVHRAAVTIACLASLHRLGTATAARSPSANRGLIQVSTFLRPMRAGREPLARWRKAMRRSSAQSWGSRPERKRLQWHRTLPSLTELARSDYGALIRTIRL